MTEATISTPRAQSVLSTGADLPHPTPTDRVALSYEDRCRRRLRMTTQAGLSFLLDLPKVTELHEGDLLCLDTGAHIEVCAAPEALMEVWPDAPDKLARIAWHVGNRHLPAQILSDHLVLRYDHVIEHMLIGLGCSVQLRSGPFTPEGGAYGQGRTHGHSH
ncbi:MAG: urease accessory protein UreE [Pseudomonadota bacterium]